MFTLTRSRLGTAWYCSIIAAKYPIDTEELKKNARKNALQKCHFIKRHRFLFCTNRGKVMFLL